MKSFSVKILAGSRDFTLSTQIDNNWFCYVEDSAEYPAAAATVYTDAQIRSFVNTRSHHWSAGNGDPPIYLAGKCDAAHNMWLDVESAIGA